jgi:hypothetical protein
MKPDRLPAEKLARLPETPVTLQPFDLQNKQRALAYEDQLNRVLAPLDVTASLFGSTELEIATKGEWEFAIFLQDLQWYPVLIHLINHYHSIHFLSDDFALFADTSDGTEIEVIAMRGEAARRNLALNAYWHSHPEAVREYEQGKIAHAYSKREYYRWKDEFIAGIVEGL